MKNVLLLGLGLALLFVAFDHTMRVDQMNMCSRGDTVPCPHGLWIWED